MRSNFDNVFSLFLLMSVRTRPLAFDLRVPVALKPAIHEVRVQVLALETCGASEHFLVGETDGCPSYHVALINYSAQ